MCVYILDISLPGAVYIMLKTSKLTLNSHHVKRFCKITLGFSLKYNIKLYAGGAYQALFTLNLEKHVKK